MIAEVADKMKKWQGRLWRIVLCYVFRCCRLTPNKIVFSNFGGKAYGDNPKYIAEELIRQNLDLELVWVLREDMLDKHTLPSRFRIVKGNSIQEIYELMTSAVWVDNLLKAPYIKKRKNQYYIQTSHGLPSLKKFEDESYVRDHKRIDLCLSNSVWFTSLARQSFKYRGEVLECGSPRNDVLFGQNRTVNDKVRKHFGIDRFTKIVLYVPTWRNNLQASTYELDIDLCLKTLKERFTGDWTFMVRLHPNVSGEILENCTGPRIVNATLYEDVQELLAVSEAILTDYSSIMFDFALTRLPVFLYTPDIESYERDTGFYFDLKDIPFPVSPNNVELARNIREFDFDNYSEKVSKFFSGIGSYETGRASEMVASKIKSHLEEYHRSEVSNVIHTLRS